VLERCLAYAVRDDALIVCRGVARAIYDFDRVAQQDIWLSAAFGDPLTDIARPPAHMLYGMPVERDFDRADNLCRPYSERSGRDTAASLHAPRMCAAGRDRGRAPQARVAIGDRVEIVFQ
jgi:hypothetical protein